MQENIEIEMKKEEIEKKLRDFIVDDLEIDEIKVSSEAKLKEDLGIDSLDVVDLAAMLRKAYGIKIVPEEMEDVKTFRQLCEYVESKCE